MIFVVVFGVEVRMIGVVNRLKIVVTVNGSTEPRNTIVVHMTTTCSFSVCLLMPRDVVVSWRLEESEVLINVLCKIW